MLQDQFAADNKVYDSNNSAVVTSGSRSVAVVFAGDVLKFNRWWEQRLSR
jgi:hypothetical protein